MFISLRFWKLKWPIDVYNQTTGYSGQPAIKIDQLKAEDKWDQEVTPTASEDQYEILVSSQM